MQEVCLIGTRSMGQPRNVVNWATGLMVCFSRSRPMLIVDCHLSTRVKWYNNRLLALHTAAQTHDTGLFTFRLQFIIYGDNLLDVVYKCKEDALKCGSYSSFILLERRGTCYED